MLLDVLAGSIIIFAFIISILGAYYVSGTSSTDRKRGFGLWKWSNIFWVFTFFMGLFGLISPIVYLIQQGAALITFVVYFWSNARGERNNGCS